MKMFSALALLATAAPAAMAGAQGPVPALPAVKPITVPPIAYTERRLPNGLRVLALRDTTTPNVTVQVWYDVGSKHDPDGRSGFAHLFEHILSRKTVNMPYNMVNRLTEDVGGSRNASTWFDRTNYYEIVPARYLETMLWTHAERMGRPVVDEQVFETERNVVKEEFRQRVLAPPYGRLRLVMDENSYDTLPMRRSGIGSLEQLDAATLADARAFQEAYYGPDTATLIVSGNFDPAALNAMVDRYFGAIPRRPRAIPLAVTATERPRTSPRAVTAYAPNVPLPMVASSWRIPGSAHPDLAALSVLDAILGGGDSSRLRRALVFDRPIATSASVQLQDVEDGGFFAPSLTLASGTRVADAEAALAAEIARVRDTPVTAAELAEAKNEILADALRSREAFSGRAFALGESLVRTGDPRSLDARLAAVGRVTAADVQRVARQYLKPEARVDVRYLDEAQRPAGAKDDWANPKPMPKWATVPAATRPPLALAAEGQRQQPPAPSAAQPTTPPAIAQSRLPNGTPLVVARTGAVPVATMAIVFPGGTSADPANRAGVAAMTADLVRRGTTTRSADQIAAAIEALGADLSADAGPDGTVLSVSAPVATLEAAGAILIDVARNATFPAGELERERRRNLDRLSVALKNPGTLAALTLQRVAYGDAPYGAVTTPASLRALTRDDLVAHRDAWWRPDTATVVVTGGVDPATATAIAGRLTTGWTAASNTGPAALPVRAAPAAKPRILVVDMPGAGQAAVTAGIRTAPRRAPGYADLQVANAVLGAGSNGRLFQEIRVKRALSYGAYSTLAPRAEAGLLVASTQTKNESAADVVGIVLAEMDRIAAEPLDATAVAQRKAFVSGGIARTAETSRGFANVIADLIQAGLPPADAARLAAQVDAVTPAAAATAARTAIAASRANVVVVGDARHFLDKLRAVHPEVQVIPAASLDLGTAALTAPTGG